MGNTPITIKIYKKAVCQKLHEARRRPEGGPPPYHARSWRGPTLGHASRAPGGRGHPLVPPLANIHTLFQKPSRGTPHHDFHLSSAAAALPRSGATEDLFSA